MENKPQDRFVELPNGIFINLDEITHISAIYESYSRKKNIQKKICNPPIFVKCHCTLAFDIIYKNKKIKLPIVANIDHEGYKEFKEEEFKKEYEENLEKLKAAKKLITDKLNLI